MFHFSLRSIFRYVPFKGRNFPVSNRSTLFFALQCIESWKFPERNEWKVEPKRILPRSHLQITLPQEISVSYTIRQEEDKNSFAFHQKLR